VTKEFPMKRLLALAITATALAIPAPASAGTYDVVACTGPFGNGSWGTDAPTGWATAYTSCPGEGIVTRMVGRGDYAKAPYGVGARHIFTAPPTTAIVGFRANVRQNSAYGWYAGLVDSSPRWIWCGGACTTWGAYQPVNVGMSTPQLFAQVTCGNPSGCPTVALDGVMAMRDVVVTVRDDTAPSVSITGGSVTAAGWHRGP
jgi:hypothetical protein